MIIKIKLLKCDDKHSPVKLSSRTAQHKAPTRPTVNQVADHDVIIRD